jgi:hypothetical protein
MLYVFETCAAFIRTVPALQHDPDRMEDVASEAEDHVGDEARYACSSRPWSAAPTTKTSVPITGYTTKRPQGPGDWRTY